MEARKIHVYTKNDKKVGFNKKLKEEKRLCSLFL